MRARALRLLLAFLATLSVAGIAGSLAFGQQVPEPPKPVSRFSPIPLPIHTLLPLPHQAGGAHSLPTIAPFSMPSAPGAANEGQLRNVALQSRLGPKVPLGLLGRLPPRTARNTVRYSAMGRRRMNAEGNSFQYSTVSGCSSTVGAIFNLGCTIQFNFVFCNANNYNAPYCYGGYQPITLSDTYQDYYIDANSNTAQTIGTPYAFGNTSTSDTGPAHQLTLNNAGTVVLATKDTTSGNWVAVVYLTVAGANGLQTYSDASRVTPSTNFAIPSSGNTTPVYITINSAQYSDDYVIDVESTSTYDTCVIVVPGGAGGAGPCNSMEVTGVQAGASGNLYMEWDIPSTQSPGTYSLIAYDQTLGKRIAQTQISITAPTGSISLTPTGGNASPNPAPAGTPTARLAFDSTSDASDNQASINISGLSSSHYDCLAVSDPNGTVHQTYPNGPFDYYCGYAGGFNLSEIFGNYQSPQNYGPNTYTVSVYDRNSNAVVASGAFQLLGYNAVTEFTNTAGTQVTGTSLVLPKGGTSTAGLEFLNDGDAYYGTGNGDALRGFYYDTGSNAVTITLPCTPCTTETVTDSSGNSWTVTLTNYGNGNSTGSSLTVTPVSTSTTLTNNGDIVIPNLTFYMGSGSSTCTNGCSGESSILPVDGLTWSTKANTASGNLTYFTNGNGKTYSGTATFIHLGTTPTGSAYIGTYAGYEPHGYKPRMSQSLYAVNEPFAEPGSESDVYKLVVTNTSSSSAGNITGIAIKLPSGYSPGTYSLTYSVDANSPSLWTQDTTCTVTGAFCIKPNGSNTGVPPAGGTETIYIDVSPLAPSSFTYSEVQISVYNPTAYSLTADSNYGNTVLVSSLAPAQETVDALAIGAYSLDGTLMTPLFNPTSEGTGTDNPVQLSVKNTSLAQDANPDYVDAVIFELPSGIVDTTQSPVFSNITSGWQYFNSVTPGVGGSGTTDYWFGLSGCSGTDFVSGDGPTANPPPVNTTLPACTTAEEQSAIAPGSNFGATADLKVGSTAGTITGTMWAHGANGGGWTTKHSFSLTVTTISATAGFTYAGGYPTAQAVPTNTTPQIGTDSNSTYGNAFVYEIGNTSASGNNLTSAAITIPYEDTSGVPGQDSNNVIWTITSTPTLSGSGWSNCTVTGYKSPTAGSSGSNGYIDIGGSSCQISSGGKLDVNFDMKAPYKPNDSYKFPTTVGNGTTNVGASENWTGDTQIQTVLQASLSVVAWPSTGPLGSLNPTCTSLCTYNQTTNLVDFGTVANGASNSGSDVVLLDVNTNAASPTDWSVYVTTCSTCNPANTAGTYAYEMNTDVDQAKSTSGFSTYMTTMTPIPTSGTGLKLVDSGGTMGSSRTAFGIVNNYEIYINGGTTSSQVSTVTYTFVAN